MAKTSRQKVELGRPRETQSRKRLWGGITVLVLLLIGGGWPLGGQGGDVVAEVRAEIIPFEGAQTPYGIPLSLDNTRQFLDYHRTAALTPAQQQMVDDALLPLRAPCCDDNSMATCCCPCNLAQGVWGLSGYLVAEKGYGAVQVRESALEWLRFIHSDYYVMEELRDRGIDPARHGLFHEDACYAGACELPFTEGGCGGMGELKM